MNNAFDLDFFFFLFKLVSVRLQLMHPIDVVSNECYFWIIEVINPLLISLLRFLSFTHSSFLFHDQYIFTRLIAILYAHGYTFVSIQCTTNNTKRHLRYIFTISYVHPIYLMSFIWLSSLNGAWDSLFFVAI